MFQLTIVMPQSQITWALTFKEEQTAVAAFAKFKDEQSNQVEIIDDFGQRFYGGRFKDVMMEDLEQTKTLFIDRQLRQWHTQIDAQRAAAADPKLKTEMMRRGNGGQPMLTPQFNS
ncbi:MAG TPA: hypothetical protein VLJ17_24500 [Xanthobacteraceae bacterium]|nr:hypothetical protein [Xanthobacteraceae bacterium]